MPIVRASAQRQVFAAILLVLLTLSGVGRSLAFAEGAPHSAVSLAGITVPICHPDSGGSSGPVSPANHDCCDACALCAPASLPEGPVVSAPAQVEHFAEHVAALSWAPAIARVHTPKLSQGPPVA